MNETIRTRANALIDYFNEHDEEFTRVMDELDSWNSYLGDDRRMHMYYLDELFCGQSASEILARALYGWDDDNWTVDQYGRRDHAPFNPNREYFYFNRCGNLVSTDYVDYSDYLCEYTMVDIAEAWDHLDLDAEPELCDLISALVDAIEEEQYSL